MNKEKIYYAHCMSIYNTPQEKRDLETIKILYPNTQIYNPSEDKNGEKGYKDFGMKYFTDIIDTCSLLIFRSLPHGKIPAGVFKEINYAIKNNKPVIELPCFTNREMSVDDTRFYLKECGFR